VFGGGQVLAESGGYYHEPTIFSKTNNQIRIAEKELFGSVLSVMTFGDAADTIKIANDSIYGLAGAVWSRDMKTAHRVTDAVRVGSMCINNYFVGDITATVWWLQAKC
jgi:4-guanidinobutyraldehyde dehydrogenase/NAD-dependent aldehyde dehydrogenase